MEELCKDSEGRSVKFDRSKFCPEGDMSICKTCRLVDSSCPNEYVDDAVRGDDGWPLVFYCEWYEPVGN